MFDGCSIDRLVRLEEELVFVQLIEVVFDRLIEVNVNLFMVVLFIKEQKVSTHINSVHLSQHWDLSDLNSTS